MKFKFLILAISRIKQAVFYHSEMKKAYNIWYFQVNCYRNTSPVPYILLNVFYIEKSNASLSSTRVIFFNEKVHYIIFSMLLKTTSVVSKEEQ